MAKRRGLEHRLEEFLRPILHALGRKDRAKWGDFMIRSLLTEGGRKNAAGMAQRFGGDVQAVQQFLNQSTWDHVRVRQAISRLWLPKMEGPKALLIDDTGFPKKGSHSVGVHRQYSGTLGKVGNCQIGVSLTYANDHLGCPLDFELYLPEAWLQSERRAAARIPDDIVFRKKWEIAIAMVQKQLDQGLSIDFVAGDAAYGTVTEFRKWLQDKELAYVLAVQGDIKCLPPDADISPPDRLPGTNGRPRLVARPEDLPNPKSCREIALSLPAEAWQIVSWREGTKGPIARRFAVTRARPAHSIRRKTGRPEPVQWLLIQWPVTESEPTNFWLSTLPETTPIQQLVHMAKSRWWIEQNYQQLKDQLGLDHFEGRSYRGWHHHVTLVMAAFAFLQLERLCETTSDPQKNF